MAMVMTGCHTKKTAMKQTTSARATVKDKVPVILMLSGTIAFDSISSSYNIVIDKQQQFEGRINLENLSVNEPPQGLYCQQTDAEGNILSQQEIDNPLSQVIEYFEGDRPLKKTIKKDKAPLFVRVQLNPMAKLIIFLYNAQTVQTIEI